MMNLAKIAIILLLSLWSCSSLMAAVSASQATNLLEIRSVIVDGKNRPLPHGGTLSLGPFPQSVSFSFGKVTNASRELIRLRYKLEGYEENWHEGDGEMSL